MYTSCDSMPLIARADDPLVSFYASPSRADSVAFFIPAA
jgi:hypothetical protein